MLSYYKYWGPFKIFDFSLYWTSLRVSSGAISFNLCPIESPYDSWERFRSHVIKTKSGRCFYSWDNQILFYYFYLVPPEYSSEKKLAQVKK